MFKLVLEKAEEPKIKLPTSTGHRKSKRVPGKNIYFCFIDDVKAFDCVDHNKLWKILREMGIPDHLTCFLRNLFAVQEATARTRSGTMDWLDLLAVQGTLMSLLQCHSSKASILQHSGFFTVQLSHPYMTTG